MILDSYRDQSYYSSKKILALITRFCYKALGRIYQLQKNFFFMKAGKRHKFSLVAKGSLSEYKGLKL